MHDDFDYESDTTRNRPLKLNRKRGVRTSEVSHRRRVTMIQHSFGGRHQRRNKHWSW
jgi:hypothetical protein